MYLFIPPQITINIRYPFVDSYKLKVLYHSIYNKTLYLYRLRLYNRLYKLWLEYCYSPNNCGYNRAKNNFKKIKLSL